MSTVIEAVDVDVPVAAACNRSTQFETFPETTRVTVQMDIDPEGFVESVAD
ncbi:hypothetical protein ACFVJR_26945 [Nocardia salmonicida]|uniref:hypothetical protein n=1 Tax=Nocardia salmonicida TaxID=53431 RepID=UPI00362D70D2